MRLGDNSLLCLYLHNDTELHMRTKNRNMCEILILTSQNSINSF